MAEKRQAGVQCLGRAIGILEYIAFHGKTGSTEIAREVGLHVATVHNILCELVNNYYLVNTDGQYSIGPGVTSLLSRYNPQTALGDAVKPYLKHLVDVTNETASVTIMVGDKAHLIGFEQSSNPIGVIFPTWVWDNPLRLATASLVIANTFTEERKASLYKRLKLKKDQITQIESCLSEIAQSGYFIKENAGDNDQIAIGLNVYSKRNVTVAGIGIAIPKFRAGRSKVRQCLAALLEVTKELSAELGCSEAYSEFENRDFKIQQSIRDMEK